MSSGELEFGRYRVTGTLGQGGFAVMYRAQDTVLGREVALKVLHLHLSNDAAIRARFLSETQVLARLDHPNVIPIYDVGESNGRPFIAMRLVAGETLNDLLARSGPLSLKRVCDVLRGVCSALDYLHSNGMVHRDIKAQNIMVDGTGRVMLMDFGIARMLEERVPLFRPGVVEGTPEAMAPEQVQGNAVGPAADIYALGVLAYKLLSGRTPFVGATAEVLRAHVFDDPPPLRSLRPDLSPDVARVVDWSLAKLPRERPSTAQAFLVALENAASRGVAADQAHGAPAQSVQSYIGRFPDLGIVSRGGFGIVHRSYDAVLGRELALKVLASNRAADPDARRRFVREARDLAGFRHPNIVTVYELGESDDSPFYAMELVRGTDLDERLRTRGTLNLAQLAEIFIPLCAAVDYIHERGIVHRDIKAANVMLEDDGRVVLMDFGIARSLEGTQFTVTGVAIGSVESMSPEQLLGDRVGPPSDIYALGVLAYKLLSGRAPFQGTRKVIEDGHLYAPPPDLSTLVPGLPERVNAAIHAALAKDPEDRPATASSLAQALADHDRGTSNVAIGEPWSATSHRESAAGPTFAPLPRDARPYDAREETTSIDGSAVSTDRGRDDDGQPTA